MKKVLSCLLCLCMVLTMAAGSIAFEAKAESSGELVLDDNNQALCPACNDTVTWAAYSGSNRLGSFTDGVHRHYYLSGDVTAKSINASLFRLASGSDLCLHLNGHDVISSAYIQVDKSTLNIMGTGNVTFTGTASTTTGYWKYGFLVSGTVNLLGGNYFLAEKALENGIPTIYQTSGATVLGDVIVSGLTDITGGNLTLSKTASLESIRIDSDSKLTVAADWTGAAQVSFAAELVNNLVPEANAVAEGAFTGKLTMADGMKLDTTADGKLFVSDFAAGLVLDDNNQALCPACKAIVTWIAYSGSNRLGSFTDGKHRHYYLSGDVTAQSISASLFRQASGSDLCLHLNGHDIISSAYIQVDKSTLNIMGTGNVTFTGNASTTTGYWKYGFMVSGTVNLMGGNYYLAEKALENGIPTIYQTSGDTVLDGVTVSGVSELRGGTMTVTDTAMNGTFLLNNGTLTLGKALNFTGDTTDLMKNGGTLVLASDFSANRAITADAASAVTTLCAATAQQATVFIGAGNRSVIYDGADIVFADPAVQLCGAGITTDYGSVWAAMKDMTEGQYVKLAADTTENITVSDTLYLDLNGKILTGSVTGEGTLFGMDSATDKYTADAAGRITGTVCCNVASNFKTDITGKILRYMAICDDNGYTFHRFYMGITHTSLRPGNTGVGYKAVFCGDAQVLEQVAGYGFTLWVGENGERVSANKDERFVSGKTVTLRLQNFDVENYGETPVYGQVYVKLLDGTTIESAEYSCNLRSLVEQVAANVAAYSSSQIQALKAMLAQNQQATAHWNIADILNYEA